MAINYSYPNIGSLTLDDIILVTDVSENNATKLASMSSIVDIVNRSKSTSSLQDILDIGNTATEDINLTGEITATDVITTSLIVNGDADFQSAEFNGDVAFYSEVTFSSPVVFQDTIEVPEIKLNETAATIDTNKFVVLDSGILKYRTGAEVLSDIGAGTSNFSGNYNDLTNKPALATVATTGSYTDLSDKPTIPTNNNELINGAGYTTNTGTVGGTGTAIKLAMWSDANTLTDSSITESAGDVMISKDTKIMGDLTIGEVGTPGDLKLPTSGSNVDVGTNTITGSDNSIALGTGNIVNAAYSIATGQSNEITGNESIAAGFGNTVIGIQSQAFGIENAAEGVQSTAFGNNTTASGPRSFSTGFGTTASGTDSTVHGNNNVAGGTNSFVAGANSTVTGFNSASIGNNLNITGSASLAVGVWNLDTGFYKFQVGVGTSALNRKNAFSVAGTGTIIAHVLAESPSYTNDSQAAAGGVPVGGLYRHGSIVQIRIA